MVTARGKNKRERKGTHSGVASFCSWIDDWVMSLQCWGPVKLTEKDSMVFGVFRHPSAPKMLFRQPFKGFSSIFAFNQKTSELIPKPFPRFFEIFLKGGNWLFPFRVTLKHQPPRSVFRRSEERRV